MAVTTPGRQPGQVTISFGQFGGLLSVLLFLLGLLAFGISVDRIRSQTTIIEQIPYLLSGGMVGLALITVGSALMIVQKSREDRLSLERRVEALVEAVLATRGDGAVGPAAGAPRDVSGLVVAGSASYHVPGCRLVDGREEVQYLTPVEARSRDLKACRVCQPDTAETTVLG